MQTLREALKQFIRLKPDIPEVHLRLGIIYSMQDTASALKKYKIHDFFIITEYRDDKTARYRVLVGRFSDKAKALQTSKTILKKLKSIIFKH